MSGISTEHTVRDFWATRPRRRTDDRKIAGVAAAIGRRYAIDPVLVRVAFVVVTVFGGSGIPLYLLGWLLLPAEGDPSSAAESVVGRGRSLMSAALTVVLVLLLILAAGVVLGGRTSGVLGFIVALGALVLLHRSRATLGEIPGSSPKAQTTGEPAAGGGERPAPPVDATQPRGPRSKVTPITLGLALLTGGIAVAFLPTLVAAQIAALLLSVVGLGLVVGSFLHSGRGLIPVAIPLALLTWVLHAAPSPDFTVGGSYWDPATAAQVRPHYGVTLGNGQLDLTGLRLAEGQIVTTSVSVGVGETHVFLPPNVDAQVSCQTQAGEVYCLGHTGSGRPAAVTVTDNGPDGPGGGKLILDVHSGIGQVHVERDS